MEKMKIFNGILSLVIVVLFVVVGISVYEVDKDLEITNQELNNLKYQYTLLKNNIDVNRMQIADLWLGTLDQEAFEKINKWEEDNTDFLQCSKILNDILIQRSYHTQNASPGKLLVYLFDKGSLVYENNGDVYCFIEPIEELYAPKGNCLGLCHEEE